MVWRISTCRMISLYRVSGDRYRDELFCSHPAVYAVLQEDNVRPHRSRAVHAFLQHVRVIRME